MLAILYSAIKQVYSQTYNVSQLASDYWFYNLAGHKRIFISTVCRLRDELLEEIDTIRGRDHLKKEGNAFLGSLL